MTQSKTPIKVKDLKPNYYQFGNKGTTWSNTAHIAKSGTFSGTLCGTPMLSSNWARIDGLEECGCEKCVDIYNQMERVENEV
jgi:hypothetical protein